MKTLDEVIKANECCNHGEPDSRCEDCPYNGIGACCAERESDALHYLKEFQGLSKMWNDKLAKEQENPPLTWDELRTMERRPVWVEGTIILSHWQIIDWVDDDKMICGDKLGIRVSLFKNVMGITWQAYRKERG